MTDPGTALVTGATGALGSEVVLQLAEAGFDVVRVARRTPPNDRSGTPLVSWRMGIEPPPDSIRRAWDVIVNCAASTRWSMTRDEAHQANVETVRALAPLVTDGTPIVHISTAFVEGKRGSDARADFRNEYERSKAMSEETASDLTSCLRIVRPPLIIGRRRDGYIARFSGTYSLLQSITSGLAPAIVGDPGARIEVAPVDDVAHVVVSRALAVHGDTEATVIAAGEQALTLRELVALFCDTLNEIRIADAVPPLVPPPFLDPEAWERFYYPFILQFVTPLQRASIETLSLFHAYTTQSAAITPTYRIDRPDIAVTRAIRWWADKNPRPARRIPSEWKLHDEGRENQMSGRTAMARGE